MGRRLLDFDPVSKLLTYHEYDATEDRTIISYEQDVEPYLDANKEMQNHGPSGPMGPLTHAASIPPIVQLEWLTKYGVDLNNKDHMPGVKRLLNSNEYRYLKVRNIII